MEHNPIFRQTRLRLAAWYTLVMGSILGLSGLGVYSVVAHAYQETIDQGLESVAKAIHKSIEPAWQQPGHLEELAKEVSLKLCLTPTNCLPKTTIIKQPIAEAANQVNYYIRLLDSSEKLFAIAGISFNNLPMTASVKQWQILTDSSGTRYRQITLPLYTQNQISGYLQVARSLTDLDQHLTYLRLTLILGLPISMIFVGLSSWWLAGRAMQPVYHSYQQMQQFTADAAHEFRTPLAAMYSTIEAAIKLQQEPKSNSSILDVLKRQNRRLSQLVGDLLLLTRIDQKQLIGEYKYCCLNDLISDLIEELAFLAVEAQVNLSQQVLVAKKIYVMGNEEQLYRLISNLIINAIQATPSGGKVTVFLENSEHYAMIKIQDTGIGIAVEHQGRIFDRFYRVDRNRSRTSGGSGLGLAIALAIALAHKGTIHLQSQPGLGSTFTVRLPL
ncbi:integral membrane sensor signal transduction histidine kinase [Tolypothrix tenuis PCC 7101]|uniref:histidine kinase n=1 Tax=Tolypothrix tenuis PCC 7101 TaxID=231146 RepID=A0A1Z4N4J3_9CYAN|nr:HAMP domain-containing histidine kinase [Aulosira sp. FACHB-113]BAZ00638.1 integral membrane sensor signal transduction histidine kinase [Tolypothrix tenuis PCC 7101]BAZ75439.1 integral membrane sensor signal transduction histidine kinase [Aulosira laxa NIES-50]